MKASDSQLSFFHKFPYELQTLQNIYLLPELVYTHKDQLNLCNPKESLQISLPPPVLYYLFHFDIILHIPTLYCLFSYLDYYVYSPFKYTTSTKLLTTHL